MNIWMLIECKMHGFLTQFIRIMLSFCYELRVNVCLHGYKATNKHIIYSLKYGGLNKLTQHTQPNDNHIFSLIFFHSDLFIYFHFLFYNFQTNCYSICFFSENWKGCHRKQKVKNTYINNFCLLVRVGKKNGCK